MTSKIITYTIALIALLTACSTDNDVTSTIGTPEFPSDENWTEQLMDGASVTVKRFEPGDAVTRSSIYYNGQGIVFGWKGGDRIGLYPTAKDATNLTEEEMEGLLSQTEFPHPSILAEPNLFRVDPIMSVQSPFGCQESTSQTTKISNGSGEFMWDDIVRWTAYFPYSQQKPEENYKKRYFSFKGQEQSALAEVGEYFDYEDATTPEDKNEHLNKYLWSEKDASIHLGNFDVMISPETKWEDGIRINFQMRHVGAIARLYLRSIPENLIIKDVKLICETPIFYEEGSFNLESHPYKANTTDFGVDMSTQVSPGEKTNKLQLDFTSNCITKKTGSGNWGPYVVAYLMMYPITYTPATDGELYAYVTAYKQGDDPTKEVHYVSTPLEGKKMLPGRYYQWSPLTHPDDGFYPIELTATDKSWTDIVGAAIDIDLEK